MQLSLECDLPWMFICVCTCIYRLLNLIELKLKYNKTFIIYLKLENLLSFDITSILPIVYSI